MRYNTLKTAFRSLMRYRTHTVINILGLSLGVTACLLIYLTVRYQLSFDRHHSKADRLYRVVIEPDEELSTSGSEGSGRTSYAIGPQMREDFPQLEEVITTHFAYSSDMRAPDNEKAFRVGPCIYTTSNYPAAFDVEWVEGDRETALDAPNSVVLVEKAARKLFGDASPIGKTVRVNELIDATVTGVVAAPPSTTSHPYEALANFGLFVNMDEDGDIAEHLESWDNIWHGETFVLVKPGFDKEAFEQLLPDFVKAHTDAGASPTRLGLQSVVDIHTQPQYGSFTFTTTKASMGLFSGLAALILLIACMNFVNLTTAQAMRRAKEVGIRKTLGGHRWQLASQFLGETGLVTLMAVGLGVLLTEVLLPAYNSTLGSFELSLPLTDPNVLLFLGGTLVVVTFLAGTYPALVMSGMEPVSALKGKARIGTRSSALLRKGLIVFQFFISMALIMATIVMQQQIEYVRGLPLGFEKDAILTLNIPVGSNVRPLLSRRFEAIPEIEGYTFCDGAPMSGSLSRVGFGGEAQYGKQQIRTQVISIDERYVDLFGLELLAGKNFDSDAEAMQGKVIVNESFMRELNFERPEEAIGHVIEAWDDYQPTVIGVVKDFHTRPAHEPIGSLTLSYEPREMASACLQLKADRIDAALEKVKAAWSEDFPNHGFSFDFLDRHIERQYRQERKVARLSLVASGVAIFIGCLGLYGLVSFMAVQRTKEVGIRKILGATYGHILALFSREFAVLLSVAFVLASVASYYAMETYWLESFVYRVNVGPVALISGGLAAALIAGAIVGLRTWRVARLNPADSLRDE